MEALDGIQANVAIAARGRRARDHPLRRSVGIAAAEPGSGQGDGRRRRDRHAGGADDDAIKWITINPAWALGLDDRIGSLEAGKNADVVLWSGDPFSVYTRAEKVWIDGALLFDRLGAGHALAHRLRAGLRAAAEAR